MLSFAQERDRIFSRWLSEAERLLDRRLERDAAFEAWSNGYGAAEYAAEAPAVAERRRLIVREQD
jgi:hypothetical protein